MEVRKEVVEAVREGAPVVALESTLISHGLPRPDNLRVAREAERMVREEGAVPATVGVVGGVAKVGLDAEEIERLAEAEGIPKLSVRDLPLAVARGTDGATTVAATAHLAARAGIRLFATGGLGGVHRGESWDVSADLMALAGTPICVVCSGVKSILDVRATLEYLETVGVTVAGYRTTRFPGFYLSDSGSTVGWAVEDEEEAARAVVAARDLGVGGMVLANPLPVEDGLDPELHEKALQAALGELRRRGVRGGDVTPLMLERLREETGGKSLVVNEKVVLGNVRLAARIAVSLEAIK